MSLGYKIAEKQCGAFLEKKNRKRLIINHLRFFFVLEAGLEPAQPQWPRDFKSLVSTDSTIRASSRKRAENEARTRDPNLGKVVLYQLSYFRISVLTGAKIRAFTLTAKFLHPFFLIYLILFLSRQVLPH